MPLQATRSPSQPDSQYIQAMFDRLAPRYDLFNHLTSMGLATYWRRETLKPVRPGMRVLDLGCGTGDLALGAARRLGGRGEAVGLDFSPRMLAVARYRAQRAEARERAGRLGIEGHIRFVEKKAEELPLSEAPFDLVVSGFVLRNLYENIDTILSGIYRSLRPGGQISFLDITEPYWSVTRWIWKGYILSFGTLYGKILFGKDYPATYLADSATRFLKSHEFVGKLEAAGFRDVRTRSFMFGMVTLYQAARP